MYLTSLHELRDFSIEVNSFLDEEEGYYVFGRAFIGTVVICCKKEFYCLSKVFYNSMNRRLNNHALMILLP